jgi:putative tricarboxylic transport membrane protein
LPAVRMSRKSALFSAAVALLVTAVWDTPCPAQAAAWKPERNIEIVVGVGPGGGIDRTARSLQRMMREQRLVEAPVSVVNKPGGGGAIAQTYLNQRAGDGHYVHLTATSLLTNHIIGKTAASHRDFTPLAMLYDEYIGFAVKADSPIRSGTELLQALRKDPDGLPIGIATSAGNTNHIAAALATRTAGGDVKKLKVVVFNSGGESMTALLGGHVAVVVTPSANLIPHQQAGRMRVVAVASPARLAGPLAVAPTWKEQGVDAVVANWRPVIAAKDLAPAPIEFWEQVFARLTQSDEWRAEIERSGGVNHYMGSRQLAQFLEAEHARFRVILSELGLAK